MKTCFYCMGNHETGQCTSLAVTKITEATGAAGDRISQAIEKVGFSGWDKMDHLSLDILGGLDGVRDAVTELQDFLSWAHSEVVWRMEKQIALLTGIHDMLKNPRGTQADELYKMGVDSFKRGRLSEALKLLKEARELNPGDYRILITLGHTHTLTNNEDAALECFKAAVAYARTDDYRKAALLLTCRALRCLGHTDEAITHAKQALSISPQYYAAQYELASCMADKLKG